MNKPHKAQDILFIRNKAVDTGTDSNWEQHTIAGFLILEGRYDTQWPQGISFVDCVSRDDQEPHRMLYGFYTQVPGSSEKPNTVVNGRSYGHIVAPSSGFYGE